jgi:hypothetical protein
MAEVEGKLTLDRPAAYRITVPGHLETCWSDWDDRMTTTTGFSQGGLPITMLTGSVDQAALQGVLRRLYSLGLPLIAVICLDVQ